MTLVEHLSAEIGQLFAAAGLPPELGEVVPSQRTELAQFQCNGAMAAAKVAGKPPREIAEDISAGARRLGLFGEVSVAGPGFMNLTMKPDVLADWNTKMARDPRHGFPRARPALNVVVDYAGPNVAKAMHVGHLRATIIGDSLARMLSFAGHRVTRDPHFGDWGFQMGLLIAAIRETQPHLPFFDESISTYPAESPVTLADLQQIYPVAADRAKNDEEFLASARQATVELQQGNTGYRALWRHMKRVSEIGQRKNFTDLGVEFDLWYGESDVHDRIGRIIDEMTTSGITEQSEGALIVRVDEEDDNREYPPLILESNVGGYMYSTTDLATIDMRVSELDADLCLYVVDRRQADHFTQVFRVARKAGLVKHDTQLEHIGFGTMNGTDGKPFKTREGGVVSLTDIISFVSETALARIEEAHMAEGYPDEEKRRIAAQVGVAALKFGDLINNRISDYIFDPQRFISFEGKTGPYLQYAVVRIKSLLAKASDQGLVSGPMIPSEHPSEMELVLQLHRFSEVVNRAIEQRSPHFIAEYAHIVALRFSSFYEACHILSEDDSAQQASWLALAQWTLDTMQQLSDLLGIEVPDRM